MATQLITRPEGGELLDALLSWRAYHLFYHANRDVILRELVWPLMLELLGSGLIDSFYFVRYSMGGPHIRIRWRLTNEMNEAPAENLLRNRAAEFFARHPSKTTIPDRQLLATNRALAATDSAERADADRILPDNSWLRFPLNFEVTRYGGPNRFPASLDLFCLSSLSVLKMLLQHQGADRGWINSAMLRLATQLAWGFAEDKIDLVRLTAYASEAWGTSLEPCIREADLTFTRQARQITDLVIAELQSLSTTNSAPPSLAHAARYLRSQVGALSRRARWPVTSSHIHMTANRIGLNNPEEVYFSRMLWRAVEKIRQQYPGTWRLLWLCHSADHFRPQNQSPVRVLQHALQPPVPWKASA